MILAGGRLSLRAQICRATTQGLANESHRAWQLDEEVGVLCVVNVDGQVLYLTPILGPWLILEILQSGRVNRNHGQDMGDTPLNKRI
jgi:hypothetical protein